MDPIEKINADRHSARDFRDGNADICFLALSVNDQPSVRTLVMRDISADGFTLFINTTSEKWRILQSNDNAELLLWYATLQKQYRVRGPIETLDRNTIENNWPRRPTGSKYLDHAYSNFSDQSKEIESHEALVTYIREFREANPEETLTTPDTAAGIRLVPETIEMLDLNNPDRIHDRKLFTRADGSWQESQLMP